jgi:hypothetical protein
MTNKEKVSKMMSSFSGSTPNINSMVGRICVNTNNSTHEFNFDGASSIFPIKNYFNNNIRNNSLASNIMSSEARLPFQSYQNINSFVGKRNTSN